ncbi:Bacteriophage protein [Mycobacteroides abscessus subsp. abscessus]|uniref:DUF732 domain-containing protein n=1 Tax=Mycobacteroides abscessus TaxID=36809 RepID=UPI000469825B|nr:DUF732 domain-containing protein [Mycobacteroides abscessus]SIK42168.1 Bacteriophage protein [Mycobacteroides abscessus subsp. abscessus]SLC46807.1 Bacteriophage protein [Mycobacteroides abscessus subsp. abscessus]
MPQHIPTRPRWRRRPRLSSYDAITVVLAAIAVLAAMLLASPDSHADPVTDDFVTTSGWRVCNELDAQPNFDGIRYSYRALSARGYSLDQSAQIIVGSVRVWCKRHVPLLKSYVDIYASAPQQSQGRAA